ncbi:MAG: PulJ/GspJ family protein, partial [Chloroflexota bacterium]
MKWTVKAVVRTLHRVVPQPIRARNGSAQGGMTLPELLIGLGIASLIALAALMAIYALLTFTRQANDTQLAVSQVRAAEHWITRDALSAQTFEIGGDSGFDDLTIEWTSSDETTVITIDYSFTDMPTGSLKNLVRDYSSTSGASSTTVVAQYIDPAQSSCTTTSSGVLEITL